MASACADCDRSSQGKCLLHLSESWAARVDAADPLRAREHTADLTFAVEVAATHTTLVMVTADSPQAAADLVAAFTMTDLENALTHASTPHDRVLVKAVSQHYDRQDGQPLLVIGDPHEDDYKLVNPYVQEPPPHATPRTSPLVAEGEQDLCKACGATIVRDGYDDPDVGEPHVIFTHDASGSYWCEDAG